VDSIPYTLWADLLGKPWRKDARGPDAYDCVGLLLEIERRLGFPVPAYASAVDAVALAVADWGLVAHPAPGDAILIRALHPRWHIGVVSGDGFMLHSREGAGVLRERYNAFPWQARIEGFYRWKQVSSPL
jgi:cell wall-associated NlpC family hydrolase